MTNVKRISTAPAHVKTFVDCAWLVNTSDEVRAQHPDATLTHRLHGDDMGQCDAWHCECGNEAHLDGFIPCDSAGNEVEPDAETWTGDAELLRCGGCGRIYHTSGRLVKVYISI